MCRYIATRRRGARDLRERLYRPLRRERDTRAGTEGGNERKEINRERLNRDGSSEERNVEAARETQEREGSQQEEESIWRRREREVIERARQDREQKKAEIRIRFESEMAAVEREYERDVVRAREDRQIAERAIERERNRGQDAERVNRRKRNNKKSEG
ncbi:octapeptide-repeat protein T2-like [Watersipora subatra]|uniref:octapeptide-repeat protein T2-like n=1 Tax=Watersipora subatra TaxID=2589382 RepID=UPI00355AD3B6